MNWLQVGITHLTAADRDSNFSAEQDGMKVCAKKVRKLIGSRLVMAPQVPASRAAT